ncbi:MAG: LPD38 domain-containing protein [Nitrospiraceae bacterium]
MTEPLGTSASFAFSPRDEDEEERRFLFDARRHLQEDQEEREFLEFSAAILAGEAEARSKEPQSLDDLGEPLYVGGDVDAFELTRDALMDATVGPFVGLAERAGFVDKGTRKKIRDQWLRSKAAFTSEIDLDTGEERSELDEIGRKAATGVIIGASNLIPLLPGGALARYAGRLYRSTAKGRNIARGLAVGAGEGAIVGFGDAAALPEEERILAALVPTGLGGLLGVGGASLANRAAVRAVAQGNGPYIRDRESQPATDWIKDRASLFYQAIFDEQMPLEKAARAVGGDAGAQLEALTQRQRISRRVATNSLFVKPEIWNGSAQEFRVATLPDGSSARSLEEILRTAPDEENFLKDLDRYMAYRREIEIKGRKERALEDQAAGREFSRDDADLKITIGPEEFDREIAPFLAEMETKYGAGMGELDRVAREVRDWSHLMLRSLESAEILSNSAVERILQKNAHYVTFQRLERELETAARSRGNAVVPRKIGGGLDVENPIVPPLEAMARMAVRTSQAIDTNLVRKSLVEARLAEIGSGDPLRMGEGDARTQLLRELQSPTEGEVPIRLVERRVRKVAELTPEEKARLGDDPESAGDDMSIFRAIHKDGPGEFSVMRRGLDEEGNEVTVRELWSTNEEMLRALQAVDPEHIGPLMRTGQTAARTLRAGATGVPSFALRNVLRDQFTAAVNSKHGFVPILTPLAQFTSEFLKDGGRHWREFVRGGGLGSTQVGLDRFNIGDKLGEIAASRRAGGRVSKVLRSTLKSPLYPFQIISELSESIPRFSEFRRARIRGATVSQAAKDASEVTLNFSRGGSFGRKWNSVEAFINAELQDLDKFARNMKSHPVRTTRRALQYIAIPSMVNYFKNHDDADYQALPEWEKSLFFHVAKREDGSFFKIPRPIGALNVAFGTSIEAFARYLQARSGAGDQDAQRAFDRWKKSFVDQVPLGMIIPIDAMFRTKGRTPHRMGRRLVDSFTPTILDPAIELTTGYDAFYETQVIPQRLKQELPEFQFTPATTETARILARPFQASPLQVESLIRGYTSNIGKAALRTGDILLGSPLRTPDPQRPELQVPFIEEVQRSFFTSPSRVAEIEGAYGFRSQPVSDLFDLREEAAIAKNTLGRAETAEQKRRVLSARPEALIEPEVRKIAQRLSALRKDRQTVLDSEDLDDAEKRSQIALIDQAVATIAATAMHNFTGSLLRAKARVDSADISESE